MDSLCVTPWPLPLPPSCHPFCYWPPAFPRDGWWQVRDQAGDEVPRLFLLFIPSFLFLFLSFPPFTLSIFSFSASYTPPSHPLPLFTFLSPFPSFFSFFFFFYPHPPPPLLSFPPSPFPILPFLLFLLIIPRFPSCLNLNQGNLRYIKSFFFVEICRNFCSRGEDLTAGQASFLCYISDMFYSLLF